MTDLPEPWQLYPMPQGQVSAIRRYIRRMTEPVAWRVQWYSRNGVDAPDRAEGRHDFDDEATARAYYESEEVQSRVGECWRVELQCRPPWRTVEAGEYGKDDE